MSRAYRNADTGLDLLPDVPTELAPLLHDPQFRRGLAKAAGMAACLLGTLFAALIL